MPEIMPITLIENFRAVFYAPFYAAFALNAWREEGVDVALRASASPENSLATLTSGAADVSWGGPMRLLLVRDKNPASDLVSFCEVVGRDPFYLVGRTPNPGFRMGDLAAGHAAKRLAVVTEVATPWYCLQYDLRLAGIDPATIKLAPGASMPENVARLRAGEVDVIQVFQPFAQQLIDEGTGHLWYSAASRGPTTYTTLNTTRAFIEREPDTVLKMTRAMYRTEQWIAAHDSGALAQLVGSYFPDVPASMRAACYDGYKASGIWNSDPIQQREGFDWLRDAMLACGAIKTNIAYEELVDMRFAQQALREGQK